MEPGTAKINVSSLNIALIDPLDPIGTCLDLFFAQFYDTLPFYVRLCKTNRVFEDIPSEHSLRRLADVTNW